MEGKLVSEILREIATEDGLDQTAMDGLQIHLTTLEQVIDGLGFCLSEEGDLLSQWRGYASDATGVAIGFSQEYLEEFSHQSKGGDKTGFTLQRVEYSPEAQKELVTPTYREIKSLIDAGAFKVPGRRSLLDARSKEEIENENLEIKKSASELSITILTLFAKLFLLKTPAFREEREWRLISYFVKRGNGIAMFHPLRDRIVPYREFPFIKWSQGAITEVVLGPKNITPDYVVESFLRQNGFEGVKISRSRASYR